MSSIMWDYYSVVGTVTVPRTHLKELELLRVAQGSFRKLDEAVTTILLY